MNISTSTASPSPHLQKADRVGVAASILCAIHCALAPILLIALPTFGEIWAHPASHILVAIFVVPLAAFSIYRGYQTHRRHWILISASIGIFFVLAGAALPAFIKESGTQEATPLASNPVTPSEKSAGTCSEACEEDACDTGIDEGETEEGVETTTGCVDHCCPSLHVDENGETSLNIPPAAIVTTLGGIFLIAAHIGNLCSCGHACQTRKCACA